MSETFEYDGNEYELTDQLCDEVVSRVAANRNFLHVRREGTNLVFTDTVIHDPDDWLSPTSIETYTAARPIRDIVERSTVTEDLISGLGLAPVPEPWSVRRRCRASRPNGLNALWERGVSNLDRNRV
jgi:hypothetical protein